MAWVHGAYVHLENLQNDYSALLLPEMASFKRHHENLMRELRERYPNLPMQGGTTIYSVKTQKLIQIIEKLCSIQKNVKMIIFVEQKVAIGELFSILRNYFSQESKKAILDVTFLDYVYGKSGDLKLTGSSQQEKVAKFRNGESKYLLSTSVLEEGLDVTDCNIVIRFDKFFTYKSLVQSRGRARSKDSHYLMLLNSQDEKLYNDLITMEELIASFTLDPLPPGIEIVDFYSNSQLEAQKGLQLPKGEQENDVEEGEIDGEAEEENKCVHNRDRVMMRAIPNCQENQETLEKIFGEYDASEIRQLSNHLIFNCSLPQENKFEYFSKILLKHKSILTCKKLWIEYVGTFGNHSEHSKQTGAVVDQDELEEEKINTNFHIEAKDIEVKGKLKRAYIKDYNALVTYEPLYHGTASITVKSKHLHVYLPPTPSQKDPLQFKIEFSKIVGSEIIVNLNSLSSKEIEMVIPLEFPPNVEFINKAPGSYLKVGWDFHLKSTVILLLIDYSTLCILQKHFFFFGINLYFSYLTVQNEHFVNQKLIDEKTEELKMKFSSELIFAVNAFWTKNQVYLPDIGWSDYYFFISLLNDSQDLSLHQLVPFLSQCELSERFTNWKEHIQEKWKNIILYKYNPLLASGTSNKNEKEIKQLVKCAIVTPFRIKYEYALKSDCRAFRIYDRDTFLLVKYEEECGEQMKREMHERMEYFVHHGLQIGENFFSFMAATQAQLLTQRCLFTCKHPAEVIQGLGDFSSISHPGKYMARIGLTFTSTVKTINTVSERIQTTTIKDITAPVYRQYQFTDGIGRVSSDVMDIIANILYEANPRKRREPIDAVQIRLGGNKGVLTVHHADGIVEDEKRIEVRESMYKFRSESVDVEVVSTNTVSNMYLNRNIVLLLSSMGIKDEVFEIKLLNYLENINKLLYVEEEARKELANYFPTIQLYHDFSVLDIEFFRKLLEKIYERKIKLLNKCQIKIEESVVLLGVVDEYACLHENEVYFQYALPGRECKELPDGKEILIFRNPCLHPGDIRKVTYRSSNLPASIESLRNVLVFPATGEIPITTQCSGGDLDGDRYCIIWDEQLILHSSSLYPPNVDLVENPPSEPDKADQVGTEELKKYYVDFVKREEGIGKLGNAWLVIADKEGALSEEAIQLAVHAQSMVDVVKTGHAGKINIPLIKEYPHFMEKPDKAFYHSTSILGKLYDLVHHLPFRFNHSSSSSSSTAHHSPSFNDDLLARLLQYKKENLPFFKLAEEIYSLFSSKMKLMLNVSKYESDLELIIARIKPDRDGKMVEQLYMQCEGLLSNIFSTFSDQTRGKLIKTFYYFIQLKQLEALSNAQSVHSNLSNVRNNASGPDLFTSFPFTNVGMDVLFELFNKGDDLLQPSDSKVEVHHKIMRNIILASNEKLAHLSNPFLERKTIAKSLRKLFQSRFSDVVEGIMVTSEHYQIEVELVGSSSIHLFSSASDIDISVNFITPSLQFLSFPPDVLNRLFTNMLKIVNSPSGCFPSTFEYVSNAQVKIITGNFRNHKIDISINNHIAMKRKYYFMHYFASQPLLYRTVLILMDWAYKSSMLKIKIFELVQIFLQYHSNHFPDFSREYENDILSLSSDFSFSTSSQVGISDAWKKIQLKLKIIQKKFGIIRKPAALTDIFNQNKERNMQYVQLIVQFLLSLQQVSENQKIIINDQCRREKMPFPSDFQMDEITKLKKYSIESKHILFYFINNWQEYLNFKEHCLISVNNYRAVLLSDQQLHFQNLITKNLPQNAIELNFRKINRKKILIEVKGERTYVQSVLRFFHQWDSSSNFNLLNLISRFCFIKNSSNPFIANATCEPTGVQLQYKSFEGHVQLRHIPLLRSFTSIKYPTCPSPSASYRNYERLHFIKSLVLQMQYFNSIKQHYPSGSLHTNLLFGYAYVFTEQGHDLYTSYPSLHSIKSHIAQLPTLENTRSSLFEMLDNPCAIHISFQPWCLPTHKKLDRWIGNNKRLKFQFKREKTQYRLCLNDRFYGEARFCFNHKLEFTKCQRTQINIFSGTFFSNLSTKEEEILAKDSRIRVSYRIFVNDIHSSFPSIPLKWCKQPLINQMIEIDEKSKKISVNPEFASHWNSKPKRWMYLSKAVTRIYKCEMDGKMYRLLIRNIEEFNKCASDGQFARDDLSMRNYYHTELDIPNPPKTSDSDIAHWAETHYNLMQYMQNLSID